jgi:hypothetical protein
VRHHRTGNDSYHRLGARHFAERHDLDIPAIVRRLNTKPAVRIEAGVFVGYLEDQPYVLGRIEAGLAAAVHQMMALCREDRLSLGSETPRHGPSSASVPSAEKAS